MKPRRFTRDFFRRLRLSRFLGLILVSAVFISSVVGTFLQLREEQAAALSLLRTTDWQLVQIQKETLRFHSTLVLYPNSRDPAARDELLLHYEILLSRFDTALRSGEGDPLVQIEGLESRLSASWRAFQAIEPILTRLEPGDIGTIENLSRQITEQEREISKLVQSIMANSRRAAVQISGPGISRTSFAVAFMCVSGLILIALLWVEIRRSHRYAERERMARLLAERHSRAKTNFLAHMSHELRTPLNAIIGYSDLLDREILGPIGNDKYRGYAQDIAYAGRHLQNLIGDILDISLIESENYRINEEEIAFRQLAESALSLCNPKAAEKKVGFTLLGDFDRRVRVDPLAIKQVLVNLIGNALRFSPEGGTIFVGVEADGRNGLRIFVRDEGPGVEPKKIGELFQSFDHFEADTSKGESYGLGLIICRQLMELHGGSISVSNNAEGGATFTIAFAAERCLDEEPAGRPQDIECDRLSLAERKT